MLYEAYRADKLREMGYKDGDVASDSLKTIEAVKPFDIEIFIVGVSAAFQVRRRISAKDGSLY